MTRPEEESAVRPFERVVVVGCNGRFGRVLAARLAPFAGRLAGVDLDPEPADAQRLGRYVRGSLEQPDAALAAELAAAECIVLCVPEAAVLAGLGPLLEAAGSDACIADIASVKTRIAARVDALGGTTGYVGLHPMFAPTESFAGRNLVLVRVRENAAAARLEQAVRTWQARVTLLTAEEHDRLAACVQAVPHAALLAFGAALERSGFDAETTERLATPVHETMLSLLARVLRGPDETYWSIQTENPYAAEARASLAAGLGELDTMAAAGDASAFSRLLERIAGHLGGGLDALVERSEHVVDAAARGAGEEPNPRG